MTIEEMKKINRVGILELLDKNTSFEEECEFRADGKPKVELVKAGSSENKIYIDESGKIFLNGILLRNVLGYSLKSSAWHTAELTVTLSVSVTQVGSGLGMQ